MEFTQLTKRENEIVELILMEMSTKQISQELGISAKTVESHRKSIYAKMGVKTVVGLVKGILIKKDDLL